MDSLLSINKLGFCEGKELDFYLGSESGQVLRHVETPDQYVLVSRIIAHDNEPINGRDCQYIIEFRDPGTVTIIWDSSKRARQEVTFNEIDLIQFIDVNSVRAYVLSRLPK